MLVDITPPAPPLRKGGPGGVVEREIFLVSGRPLARWVAESIGQVEDWVTAGKDPTAWIDLEIRGTPGTMASILSLDEIQKLRKLCPRFVNVRTPLPEPAQVVHPAGLDKLPIDELFRRFYKKHHGAEPEETLVRLFMEMTT